MWIQLPTNSTSTSSNRCLKIVGVTRGVRSSATWPWLAQDSLHTCLSKLNRCFRQKCKFSKTQGSRAVSLDPRSKSILFRMSLQPLCPQKRRLKKWASSSNNSPSTFKDPVPRTRECWPLRTSSNSSNSNWYHPSNSVISTKSRHPSRNTN